MNEDFRDPLAELIRVEARFLVVGADPLAVHGVPRATGGIGAETPRPVRGCQARGHALV